MKQRHRALHGLPPVLGLALVAGMYGYSFRLAQVRGQSMEPTFHSGQWLLVRRLNWPAPPLHRGDIIVFRHAGNELVKRIAALPGEPSPTARDIVLVGLRPAANGSPSSRGAIPQTPGFPSPGARPRPSADDRIPPARLYVLGDNSEHSEDSRDFGPIPQSSVIGRVIRWTRRQSGP